METINEIISDEQITLAWGNADFGNIPKRDLIANALLKYACGYTTGYTIFLITRELGLVSSNAKLTKIGKKYLYFTFAGSTSV